MTRCSRCARSCSTASTSAERVEPEHRHAPEVVKTIFDQLVERPERLPPGDGELADRLVDYVSGMTDRFALSYAADLL